MDEAHYDTPWEYKTRNFAVLKPRPHSETVGQNLHPSGSAQKLPSPTLRGLRHVNTADSSRSPFTIKKSPPMTFNRFNDSRGGENSTKRHCVDAVASTSPSTPNFSSSRRRSGRRCSHGKMDESIMIHENINREDAEKLLKYRNIGDFLLRRRPEGNLAMSLRANEGVLHIKLERREDHWIVGEGPAFESLTGALRYYRKTQLPIRGAEHLLLKTLLTATPSPTLCSQCTANGLDSPEFTGHPRESL